MQTCEWTAAHGPTPSAYETLTGFLEQGEQIEAMVFSKVPHSAAQGIPNGALDRVLSPFEAAGYMHTWSLLGGFGEVVSYAMLAWTNKRLVWVTQYDGRTTLHAAPISRPVLGSHFTCQMPGDS